MDKPTAQSVITGPELPELRWRWVVAVAVVALLATGAVMWLLVAQVGRSPDAEQAKAELDAIRTALGISVGAGGAFALWLATRRQRATETQIREHARITSDEKKHREQTAAVTKLDLSERRITDLYTKAVEQLGSEKAPVRLGGLYALERIANDNPGHRQTIVNVICAYLRMPYRPPAWSRRGPVETDLKESDPPDEHTRREELQVRLTAQRILADHLKNPATDDDNWGALDIDLQEAVLVDLRMNNCDIGRADFAHCRFVGATHIRNTTFTNEVWFFETAFDSLANLSDSSFLDREIFTATRFEDNLFLNNVTFRNGAYFPSVRFSGPASFQDTKFYGDVEFENAHIENSTETTERIRARNTKLPQLGIIFSGATVFDSIKRPPSRSWPPGWEVKKSSSDSHELFYRPQLGASDDTSIDKRPK